MNIKTFVLTLALGLCISFSNAAAANCANPQKFVEGLSGDVIKVIESKSSEAGKEAQLTSLFKRNVNTNWMGKFVLGRNWKELTPAQQNKYLSKYSDYLVASYVPTFKKYSGEKITVGSVKQLEKDGEFVVHTTIARPEKESVIVNYRVKKEGACYKINDIVAEGISLLNAQRQDFSSVFSSKGFDGLMESLDRKINAPAVAAN